MENGLTLIQYINEYHPQPSDELKSTYIPTDFQNFLHSIIIVKTSSNLTLNQTDRALSYLDLVDSILCNVHNYRTDDVLVNGYSIPLSQTHTGIKVVNPEISFVVNHLKGVHWNHLFNCVGVDAFSDIVLNTTCYLKQNELYVQLWGKGIAFAQQVERKTLPKQNMMYKNRRVTKVNNRLLSDSISILSSMFPNINTKNLPKSFRKLKKLLDRVILNHQACNYDQIFSNIVPFAEPIQESILKNATEMSSVIRFCLTIMGKVFPLETWGTSENKVQIFRYLARYLKSRSFEKIHLNEVTYATKITSIKWLGRTQNVTSRQDRESRLGIFSTFIHWVFIYYLQNIVRSFWYVTDSVNSDEVTLLYFPHYSWNQIQEKWLNNYISKYLVKVSLPSIIEKMDFTAKYNFGRLRLAPKLNDFRLICVPSKLAINSLKNSDEAKYKKNKYEYLHYRNNIIRPARQILSFKLNFLTDPKHNFYSRCQSSRDIAISILNYKKHLTCQNHSLPEIHMVKFDMKHCFDRLNQSKIVECVENLFAGDEDEKLYFIRQYWETSTTKKMLGKLRSLIVEQQKLANYDLIESDILSASHSKLFIDRSKTISMSKKRLIQIVKSQVFDSLCMGIYENSVYRRKHGVFQGFALLSILCDIVYDAMVLENFAFLEESGSRLFRLVDDFLILSTDTRACNRVLLILDGCSLQKYGAFVNAEKTGLVMGPSRTNLLKFVGLSINTSTLDISRIYPKSSFMTITKQKSFKSTYTYLTWCFTARMDNFLVSMDLVSLSVALSNITHVLVSTLNAFYLSCKYLTRKRHEFDQMYFQSFLLELLLQSLTKFRDINASEEHIDDVFHEFKECVAFFLSDKDMFAQTLHWITELNL